MESNWQKDYPTITDLSEEGLDENTSFKKMARFIGDDKHVIDFGCATGYFAQVLTQKGCTVTGVEINSSAAKVAEQYCEKVIVADLDFTTLTDILPCDAFDVAIFGDVLEHLRDPWRILEETKQLLKPDGYVVVSIPNVAHGAVRLALLQGKFEYEKYGLLDNTHLRFFTRETVEELFERTGYFVDARARTVIPIFSGSELIPAIDRSSFDSEIVHKIEKEEDSDTLQFILRAFPLTLEGKFSALGNKYSELLEQYKRLQSEKYLISNNLVQTQAEVQQAQAEVQQAQAEVQQAQAEVQQAQATLDQCLSENSVLQEKLKQAQAREKHAQSRFHWAQSQLKYSQDALGGLEAQVRSLQGQARHSKSKLDRSESKIRHLQVDLENLQEDLSEAHGKLAAIQTSKFWKFRTAWFKAKRLIGLVSPESEMFAFNQPQLTSANQLALDEKNKANIQEDDKLEIQKIDGSVDPGMKMFAFISDCPGDAYRYRCQHQAEMLEYLGYTVDVYEATKLPYNKLLKHYQVVVVHRVPHTYEFEQFILKAKQKGTIVVYETDDFVFDSSRMYHIDAYMGMNDDAEQRLYEDGVRRYRQSLSLCNYAVVSTDKLKQEIETGFPDIKVVVSRNRISRDIEREASKAWDTYLPDDGILRIGYFSGTKTHAKDFAECVPALKKILQEFSYVHLMIVGHLDIPEELQDLSAQIEYIPLVHWKSLPLLYRRVDINLAPLEQHNDFTESKSELKYFEAGLLSVPTVASDLSSFRVAIQDGYNGRLCKSPAEWERALHELIMNPELRQRMGQAAFEDVKTRYLTRVAASETGEAWKQLISGRVHPTQPLSIGFVLRAPIAQTGGGYKHIFNLAHHLVTQGHEVHLYIEPNDHLKGLSLKQIQMFCEENFGKSRTTIHRGHDNILPSDVLIATNWPTAHVVDKLDNTKFKAYYVQDYETYFYKADDPCFAQAESTYDLSLGIITLGKYLSDLLSQRNHLKYPYIDFSLNETFFAKDPALDRHYDLSQPCSILFFARPNIPRRNFALGVKVLEKLHEQIPDVLIRLYGMEEDLSLPFPYENLGILNQSETADAMRSASIHLSFSMTNITTVIFEAMACGCATVEADVPPVRGMVQDGETCLLAKPSARDVCDALLRLVEDVELRRTIATAGFNSVKHLTIENMCSQFELILQQYSFRRE